MNSKERSDQSKTKTQQEKHQILQLHTQQNLLSSKELRQFCLSISATYSTHISFREDPHGVCNFIQWNSHGSDSSNILGALMQFKLHIHSFIQLLIRAALQVSTLIPTHIAWLSVALQDHGTRVTTPSILHLSYLQSQYHNSQYCQVLLKPEGGPTSHWITVVSASVLTLRNTPLGVCFPETGSPFSILSSVRGSVLVSFLSL